jgi:hydroxyethylthiazole kinase-like uncharacterized protein yjeF
MGSQDPQYNWAMADSSDALPREIYSTAQVRQFDRRAIDEHGIPGFELMRRAGAAAMAVVRERWPQARGVLVYCGGGNNGGDGYVLAARLAEAGLSVRVVAVVGPEQLKGDAATALALARAARVDVVPLRESAPADFAPDVVVDAVLGTGLSRDVNGAHAEAVARINACSCPVLALDVPSGLDSDSGAIRGIAVGATVTLCLVGLKAGLFLDQGPAVRGSLAFADLAIPAKIRADAVPVLRRMVSDDLGRLLSVRSRISHKGLNGRVLIVGGSAGMGGAARLAAEAALRCGAGLVHAAVAPASVSAVMSGRPEIMGRAVDRPDELVDWAELADVIVVGPGLGRDARAESLCQAVLAFGKPLVVDADALHFLPGMSRRRDNWVLTPHPGEAARLLGCPTAAVQANRRGSVAALAAEFGGVAVLKGACTLVNGLDPADAPVTVCDYGNPGMASGGMGDVLSGVVGALIGQFGFSRAAVEAGVLVHALAGDDAARDGERGLLASDLFPFLRHRVNPR